MSFWMTYSSRLLQCCSVSASIKHLVKMTALYPRLFSVSEKGPTLNTSNAVVEEMKFASKLKCYILQHFIFLACISSIGQGTDLTFSSTNLSFDLVTCIPGRPFFWWPLYILFGYLYYFKSLARVLPPTEKNKSLGSLVTISTHMP